MRAGAAAGLALSAALLAVFGLAPIAKALALAGWAGLAAVVLAHLPSLALCAAAWRQAAPEAAGSARTFLLARWIRDGAGNAIVALPLGGELAGARVMSRLGVDSAAAAASVLVDVTMELAGQLLFVLAGLSLLALCDGRRALLYRPGAGLLLSFILLAAFVLAQKKGASGLTRWIPDETARGFRQAIQAAYERPRRLALAAGFHFLAWVAAAGETWIALALLGHSTAFWQTLTLESLVFALRTAVFVVPGGIGVQEAGYVMVGAWFGLPPQAALALSLLKRGRELALALPSLAAWQALESNLI